MRGLQRTRWIADVFCTACSLPHRYHDHSRGSWTAGEVSGITGDGALFCIPAQQTIPLLVRWMLVFEDSDEETLYLGRALPRKWIAAGKPIGIEGAPTRWGRVDFRLAPRGEYQLVAIAAIRGEDALPKQMQVRFRIPAGKRVVALTVDGKATAIGGRNGDTAVFRTQGKRNFEVVAHLA